ncbi:MULTISPECIES: glycosyltransferase family 9 protein [unclassified Pseudomonas]|uniref:glycosyltransferase family 9 protein n=1 Tax=unclassified Pseudomonas TaxID=196821 RepID=UPI0021C8E37C|nr:MULTISPECIES: glycosyltransferase family 9 protein [unclassified Pseudomonas]MCU1730116.1 lipopolysaccharide heptosyltransferase family protein [Pseudomonas sp. 20P_3.2_Bac4]MCU1747551.1 lipopolysaccharide heptosyltransferase family protein [Pseudomonas sp. 20P_3.2_Bac5]
MRITEKHRKAAARFLMRVLTDRRLSASLPDAPLHIVVPRWDAKLGDAIVSSFFFREAKKLNARVTVLTVEPLADLHKAHFGVDQVLVTDENPGALALCRLARQLGRVDVMVHLVGRIQPAEMLFIRLLKPARVYSLDDQLRCVNRKFGAASAGLDVAGRFARVLADLGLDAIQCDYIVPLAPTAPKNPPHLLVNPYASRADKSLSPAKARQLLRALADAWPGKSIGILCSPASRKQARLLAVETARDNVRCLEDLNTPKEAASYISRAQAVVSVDTAIVHMAVGLRAPLLALYPDSGDGFNPWLPPASPHTRVIFSRQCPDHYRRTGKKDMNAFAVEEVIEGLADLLPASAPRPALALDARIIAGLGVARGTLARQLPLISREFPEVHACHPGTLNLQLEHPLHLLRPDHRTAPLAWTPSGRSTEVFDLLRIELEFAQMPERIPAWLYIAHGSVHRQTPSVHEVIAGRLDLDGAGSCRMHIPADAVRYG